HALYRFFDSAGELLYVGITNDPGRRLGQHRKLKPWWASVGSMTLEHFSTREALEDAEREAIAHERPIHNVALNRPSQTRPISDEPVRCERCGYPALRKDDPRIHP